MEVRLPLAANDETSPADTDLEPISIRKLDRLETTSLSDPNSGGG